MQVLPEVLKAKGGSGKIKIDLLYFSKRGIRQDGVWIQNGKIFTIAQWYPRMCVYDMYADGILNRI
jgi:hypothetical protein